MLDNTGGHYHVSCWSKVERLRRLEVGTHNRTVFSLPSWYVAHEHPWMARHPTIRWQQLEKLQKAKEKHQCVVQATGMSVLRQCRKVPCCDTESKVTTSACETRSVVRGRGPTADLKICLDIAQAYIKGQDPSISECADPRC